MLDDLLAGAAAGRPAGRQRGHRSRASSALLDWQARHGGELVRIAVARLDARRPLSWLAAGDAGDPARCAQAVITGRLLGIGVGPGDPELMTLKAVRYPAAPRRSSPMCRPGPTEHRAPDRRAAPAAAASASSTSRCRCSRCPSSPRRPTTRAPRGSAPSSSRAATSPSCARAIRCSTARSASCSIASASATRPRSCRAWSRSPRRRPRRASRWSPHRDLRRRAGDLAAGMRSRARLGQADAAAILKLGRHLAKVREVLAELGLLGARDLRRACRAACASGCAPGRSRRRRGALFRADPAAAAVGRREQARQRSSLLGPSGLEAARRIARGAAGRRAARAARALDAEPASSAYDELAAALRELFAAGRPIVALCAAGILIRVLAPLIGDKRQRAAGRGARRRRQLRRAAARRPSRRQPAGPHDRRGARLPGRDHDRGRSPLRSRAGCAARRLAVRNPEAAKAVTSALLRRRGGRACGVEAGDADWLRAGGAPFGASGELEVLRDRSRRCRAPRPASCCIPRCWRSASAASAGSPPRS